MPAHQIRAEVRHECGFECPRYVVPLLLPTRTGERIFEFIFDTGADISLFPLPQVDESGLQYRRDRLPAARPVTLAGSLAGHTGEIEPRLRIGDIDVTFSLPCFFYDPDPPTASHAPDRVAPARDLDNWEQRTATGSARPTRNPRAVLGRLGFLSRFRVFAHHERFVVATDDTSLLAELRTPPKRKRS